MAHDSPSDEIDKNPRSEILLGDLPISDGSVAPRGGINPHSPAYRQIGNSFLDLLINHASLDVSWDVLELGCGTGRIASALDGFLSEGSYVGFDVNQRFINFCREQYPNRHFDCFDIHHDEYNPKGELKASEFVFPYPDDNYNLVFAIALFNHMDVAGVSNYISEASRILKPGGMFFGTFLLLNGNSIRHIDSRSKRPFKFDLREQQQWFEYSSRPYWNVALAESSIRRMFIQNKLMIKEPIRYGEWCGSSIALTGHDVILAMKDR